MMGSWSKIVSSTAKGMLVCAVPALALAWFGPNALESIAQGSPSFRNLPTAPVAVASGSKILDAWQNTETEGALQYSLSLNQSAALYQTELNTLPNSDPAYAGLNSALLIIIATDVNFELFYKTISSSLTVTQVANSTSASMEAELQTLQNQINQPGISSTAKTQLQQLFHLVEGEATALDTYWKTASAQLTAGTLTESAVSAALGTFFAAVASANNNLANAQVLDAKNGTLYNGASNDTFTPPAL